MASVQVRNVPESVKHALRRTADIRGESLQQYLLSVLSEQARVDQTATVLAEAGEDARECAGPAFDSAEWVRAVRGERADELAARHEQ